MQLYSRGHMIGLNYSHVKNCDYVKLKRAPLIKVDLHYTLLTPISNSYPSVVKGAWENLHLSPW